MGTLEHIAEIAGEDAARIFAEAFGGRRIYLPRHPASGHALSVAVGHQAAVAICRALGPGHLNVPLGARDTIQDFRRRGRRIIELTRAGLSAPAIAGQLGCTQRTVHKWRARARVSSS